MAEFTKVVVHFPTANGERTVVIRPNGPVTEILLDRKVRPDLGIPPKLRPLIEGGPLPAHGDGPLVCYMLDGQMVCW